MRPCKYGVACYRRNAKHLADFWHPPGHMGGERKELSTAPGRADREEGERVESDELLGRDEGETERVITLGKRQREDVDMRVGRKRRKLSKDGEVEHHSDESDDTDGPRSRKQIASDIVETQSNGEEPLEDEGEGEGDAGPGDDAGDSGTARGCRAGDGGDIDRASFSHTAGVLRLDAVDRGVEDALRSGAPLTITEEQKQRAKSLLVHHMHLAAPETFFALFESAVRMNSRNPLEAFVDEHEMRLCGAYEILLCALSFSEEEFNERFEAAPLALHSRYMFDPPEVVTVMDSTVEQGKHWGFVRDDPTEVPEYIVRGHTDNPEFTVVARSVEEVVGLSTAAPSSTILSRQRGRGRTAKTMSKLGIKVPVVVVNDMEVGYRPLHFGLPKFKRMMKDMIQKNSTADLNETITNVQFANDEGDFGMGLELGLNVFCYASPLFKGITVRLLRMAYTLLQREAFSRLVVIHLQHREESSAPSRS